MKKKVKLQIESILADETIEQELEGYYYEKANASYIHYVEPLSTMGRTSTIIKLEEQQLKIIRHGDTKSEQIFVPNQRTRSSYHTPNYSMELEMMTEQLDIQLMQGIGYISLKYDLYIHGQFAHKNLVMIRIVEDLTNMGD